MSAVMFEGVLAREREPVRSHATLPKDFAIMMEPVESGVESVERIFSQNVLAGSIAEVEECIKSLDDIGVYEAFKCSNKYLAGVSIHGGCSLRGISYLHQCFGVISRPLLEVLSLFEPSKARKEGGKCNPINN